MGHTAVPSARILDRVREDAADLAVLASTPAHDWQFVSEKNNTRVYEMSGGSLPERVSTVRTFGKGGGGSRSQFYLVRAVTTLGGVDLNAVLDLLHTSSTEQFRALMKTLFAKHYENAAVVDSLSCTTPPPFAGSGNDWHMFTEDDGYSANWLTLRAFSKLGGLENHRDMTMVCYQDVFQRHPLSDRVERVGRRAARDPLRKTNGSRLLGVHTFSSMNFKDLPELPKSSKTDRLHFRNSGLVAEETGDGTNTVRLSLFLCLLPSKLVLKEVTQSPRMRVAQAQGPTIAKKYVKWLQALAFCVSNLAQTSKPELTVPHVADVSWTDSDHCYLCLKIFRTYRRRHHCRFCGEAVCASCSGFVHMSDFDVTYADKIALRPGSAKTHRNNDAMAGEEMTDARGCTSCVAELKMTLAVKGGARGPHSQSSSHSGSSLSISDVTSVSNLASLGSQRSDGGKNRYLQSPDSRDGYGSTPTHFEHGARPHYFRGQPSPDHFAYQHQQMRGKPSISTISSSSYSGRSHDEHTAMMFQSSGVSTAPSADYPRSQAEQSFSGSSDASLSAFLARDPDILALRGLALGSPGDSELQYRPTMDDEVRKQPAGYSRPSAATTTTTATDGSNHSQYLYSNMTTEDAQAAAAIVTTAARNGTVAPATKQITVNSSKLYYSSASRPLRRAPPPAPPTAKNDMIHLSSGEDFVVFNEPRQTEMLRRADASNDMIPLKL